MRRSARPSDLVRATVGGAPIYGAKFVDSMLTRRPGREAPTTGASP
jgi:hypothetical protein